MAQTENCPHTETYIVVLDAFDMHEMIGFKCKACKEIVKTQTN
jgi:hypothetical protein